VQTLGERREILVREEEKWERNELKMCSTIFYPCLFVHVNELSRHAQSETRILTLDSHRPNTKMSRPDAR
jgi:hypothetical protein